MEAVPARQLSNILARHQVVATEDTLDTRVPLVDIGAQRLLVHIPGPPHQSHEVRFPRGQPAEEEEVQTNITTLRPISRYEVVKYALAPRVAFIECR